MKTKVFLLTGFIGIVSCLVFSQTPVKHGDSRDIYVGNYLCTCICQGVDTDQNRLAYQRDTIILSITKDRLDSLLNIDIGQNMYRVKLKDGVMYAYPPGQHWGGKLSSNSISFGISAGMTTMCKYKGKKKP
jgi:hypothetical protein